MLVLKQVVVASVNPVKIEAVRRGLARLFPQGDFDVRGVSVPSGVSDQPMAEAETFQGALNRAQRACDAVPDADLWLGIEGGVESVDDTLQGFAWVIALGQGLQGRSRTATFILPEEVAQLVRDGMELGHADDVVFRRQNSKHAGGSVGLLTGAAVDRTVYYEQAVILALIPFRNPHLTFR